MSEHYLICTAFISHSLHRIPPLQFYFVFHATYIDNQSNEANNYLLPTKLRCLIQDSNLVDTPPAEAAEFHPIYFPKSSQAQP